jgi:hypothetical protein
VVVGTERVTSRERSGRLAHPSADAPNGRTPGPAGDDDKVPHRQTQAGVTCAPTAPALVAQAYLPCVRERTARDQALTAELHETKKVDLLRDLFCFSNGEGRGLRHRRSPWAWCWRSLPSVIKARFGSSEDSGDSRSKTSVELCVTRTQAVYYRAADGSEPVSDFVAGLDERKQPTIDLQIDRLNDQPTTAPPPPFPHSSQMASLTATFSPHDPTAHARHRPASTPRSRHSPRPRIGSPRPSALVHAADRRNGRRRAARRPPHLAARTSPRSIAQCIPHHRLGHYVRFNPDDLKQWLHEIRSTPHGRF